MSAALSRPATGEPSTESLDDRRMQQLLAGASITAVVVWWLLELNRSLTLDGTITAWVTDDGLSEVWGRSTTHQANGPAYFTIIWVWRQIAGGSEIALRLPSLAAAGVAAAVVYRLGRDLGGRTAGLVSMFVFVASADVALRATTARPYALQILAVCISTSALIRWTRGDRPGAGLTWILAGVAAVWLHPFGALLAIPHGLYLLLLRHRGAGPPIRTIATLAGLGAVTLSPLVVILASVREHSGSLVFAEVPGFTAVVAAIIPGAVLAAVAIGLLVGRCGSVGFDPADPDHVLTALWAVVPVTALYTVSLVTADSIFVPRYFSFTVAGAALVAGVVIAGIRTPAGRHAAIAALILFAFIELAPGRAEPPQDWQAAVEWVEERVRDDDALLLVDAGLIETGDPELIRRSDWATYLAAPVSHYAPGLDTAPLPIDGADAAWIESVVDRAARERDSIALLTTIYEYEYPQLITEMLTARGWTPEVAPEGWRVDAIVFRR